MDERAIPVLRSWCFSAEPLTPAPEELTAVYRSGLKHFCHFYYQELLSPPRKAAALRDFLTEAALDLRLAAAAQEISEILQQAGIRAVPFKGMAMRRFYPHPALRIKGDIDLLLPRKEIPQAAAALKKTGWEPEMKYWHPMHAPEMKRAGVSVELHHTLPGFQRRDMDKVWQLLAKENELPPELNLPMLFHHFVNHGWRSGTKLLLDYGFLLGRGGHKPDWELIASRCREFKLYSPALLFAAFPDFFPAEMIPPQEFTAEEKHLLREKVLAAETATPQHEVMNDPGRFSPVWLRRRLNGLRPGNVRRATGNLKGNYTELLRDYCRMNGAKIVAFFAGLRRDEPYRKLLQALRNGR